MTRRPFTIAHLSDLHIGGPPYANDFILKQWQETLKADLNNLFEDSIGERFLVVSGDLTFSGTSDQFELAGRFLHALASDSKIPREHVIIVPGNHDYDRSPNTSNRDQLKNFEAFRSFLMSDGLLSRKPSLVFHEQRLAFLLLNSDTPKSAWVAVDEQFERETNFNSSQIRDYFHVLVAHHPPKWLEIGRDEFALPDSHLAGSSSLQNLNLILHGHSDTQQNWVLHSSSFGERLQLAAATSLSEPWRSFTCGDSRTYNMISVTDKYVQVRRRSHIAALNIWRSEPELTFPLLSAEINGAVRDLDISTPTQLRDLYEQIAELPRSDLMSLLAELGPSIRPYLPIDESLSSFAKRLVDYFQQNSGLTVLKEALDRHCANSSRVQIFISYGKKDLPAASKVADVVRHLGHEVWLDNELEEYQRAFNLRAMEALQRSDILITLLTAGGEVSSNVLYELGAWLSVRGSDRIIPIVIGNATLPELLRHYPAVKVQTESGLGSYFFKSLLHTGILSSLAGKQQVRSGVG
jgi:hypothetical protein